MLRIEHNQSIHHNIKLLSIIFICIITFISDWSCIASLIILAFGTNRGHFKYMKWLFYIYYPLHLFIIGLLLHFI